ncbi:MAG TPA: hypothetical protein VFY23_15805 [Candidatus Limnocylindrales bacterium]|nr:hypothetical protein [Candidatus Limnocylindrales bacterium]
MGRRTLTLAAAGLLVLGSTVPVLAAEGDPGKVMIMKHACTEQPVKDEADFDAIIDQAEGDEITALALTVLACPTIVLADDEGERTDGVAGPAVDFEFTLTDANGDTQTLDDAMFVAAKLCETDIDRDANGDGEKTDDVCLDISHYMFSNVPAGEVTVEETRAPNGWTFGTLLLTPQALQADGSNDAATGADYGDGTAVVTLDLAADADNDAMLHIYNFEKSPATDTVAADTGTSSIALRRAV